MSWLTLVAALSHLEGDDLARHDADLSKLRSHTSHDQQ